MTGLFDANEYDKPIRLRDRYGVPPFSVLDTRTGEWQSRRYTYLGAGLSSVAGRTATALTEGVDQFAGSDYTKTPTDEVRTRTSIFDPVLAELIVRWYTAPGLLTVDPFAGGSVRGIISGMYGRNYLGVDLSAMQVEANLEQLELLERHLAPTGSVEWEIGDALESLGQMDDKCATGGVYTCPPYYDLEVYSDDPRDISTWPDAEFDAYCARLVKEQYRISDDDTFATWVVSEVRGKDGNYRRLLPKTVDWHIQAGYAYYQEAVLLNSVNTARLRAPRYFDSAHKLVSVHQNMLVFLKGDAKRAAAKVGNDYQTTEVG